MTRKLPGRHFVDGTYECRKQQIGHFLEKVKDDSYGPTGVEAEKPCANLLSKKREAPSDQAISKDHEYDRQNDSDEGFYKSIRSIFFFLFRVKKL